jgi:aryl-alcohol dehydrogenase-like predicted oxidoreductase
MEQRPYGATGLQVSVLAYGAMGIAADPDLKNGIAPSLLTALDAGVNLIDTARVYPGSEALIASTLAAWKGEPPLISTKLRAASRETYRFHRPLTEAYTRAGIRASVDASLAALGVETLDIVHLHQWHALWIDEPEWLEELQALRREGKLRFVAVSVQDHEHDAALELVSRRLVDGVQLILNLFESRPLNGFLPLCERRGVGAIARCVFDSGGLSGELDADGFVARNFLKHAPYPEYRQRLDDLLERFTPTPARDAGELALRFAISSPSVSAATVGMPDRRQVAAAVDAVAQGPLPAAAVEAIQREHVWTKNFYEALI